MVFLESNKQFYTEMKQLITYIWFVQLLRTNYFTSKNILQKQLFFIKLFIIFPFLPLLFDDVTVTWDTYTLSSYKKKKKKKEIIVAKTEGLIIIYNHLYVYS